MKKSKKILLVSLIIVPFVAVILFLNYLLSDKSVLKGYYKSELNGDKIGFQHFLEYYKYYYDVEKDAEFSTSYNKVDNENIDEIKLYYNDFKGRMFHQDRLDEFDLNENSIDENDYFLLYDKNKDFGAEYIKFSDYTLYFYDTSLHILYILHNC